MISQFFTQTLPTIANPSHWVSPFTLTPGQQTCTTVQKVAYVAVSGLAYFTNFSLKVKSFQPVEPHEFTLFRDSLGAFIIFVTLTALQKVKIKIAIENPYKYTGKDIPHVLRSDRKRMLRAIHTDAKSFCVASQNLQQDDSFILEAIHCNSAVLGLLSKKQRKNPKNVLPAVRQCGLMLEQADNEIKNNNLEIVLEAIQQNKEAYQFVGNNLKYHPSVLERLDR